MRTDTHLYPFIHFCGKRSSLREAARSKSPKKNGREFYLAGGGWWGGYSYTQDKGEALVSKRPYTVTQYNEQGRA